MTLLRQSAAPSPLTPASDASRAPDRALAHARAILAIVFGEPAGRAFDVRYWEGTLEPGAVRPAPFTFCVRRPGALRRMLLPPSELAIVESYLSGDVDVEGDLEAAVVLGDAIERRLRSARALGSLVRHLLALPTGDGAPDVRDARAKPRVTKLGRRHAERRDRVAVRYHYDVGNDFYALWLDRRMVYSCGYFRTPHATLDDAQRDKLELVCRKLRLRPGQRLLDVGCGWGALVIHAAEQHGVTALGITLSERQAQLARERIAMAGLESRCTIEIRDYRELGGRTFDRIASIGMVEHVGLARLPDYFAALARALEPGGLLLNHGIVRPRTSRPRNWRQKLEHRLWRRDAFIDQYVFPDGELTPLPAVLAAAEGAGLETRDVENLREHYALTLRHWTTRLMRNAEQAIAAADERTWRTWRLYMSASAHSFAIGRIGVAQVLLAKRGPAGTTAMPMTREDVVRGW